MRQRRAVFALGGARKARVLRRTATAGFGGAKIPAGGLPRRDCRSLRLRGAPPLDFCIPGFIYRDSGHGATHHHSAVALQTELGAKLPRARNDDGGGGADDDDRTTGRPTDRLAQK